MTTTGEPTPDPRAPHTSAEGEAALPPIPGPGEPPAPPDDDFTRQAEWEIGVAFVVTILAALSLAVVYARGGQPQLEGALLGISLFALGYGLVVWARRLLPSREEQQQREPLADTPEAVAEVVATLEEGGVLTRRKALRRLLVGAGASLGLAALFPIRSLGPSPGSSLKRTPWTNGLRLVDPEGRPVRAEDVPLDGLVTVFPEGHVGSADGQAVLIRVRPELLQPIRQRADWAPEGFVAYSKVCSHAGCPVGLYQAQDHSLLCPCHQSTFDVLRHARPTFGPAARPLPQLPLRINAQRELEATGDFSDPVGPAWWTRP